MSRSSGLYFRHKKNQRLNESEDFLDFNEFGPDADAEHDVTNKQMTLDEFVNLPIFNTENSQKAIIALKNNETIELQNNDDSVKLSSSDNETVTIEYGDIVLDFSKNDLLQALQENIELEVSESVLKFKEFINENANVDKTHEDEMPSVLKFKEFLQIEKNEAKQDGKDSF